jgi:hypothetical protein
MATLTEVSFYTRRIIKYGAIGLAVVMITPIIWGLLGKLYLILRPPPPPAPTVAYGKIPKIKFADNPADYKPTLRLETVDGKLPVLPNVSNVYLVEVNKSRLLQLDRVKTQAASLGFVNEPEKLSDQLYKFTHPTLPATLLVDVIYNIYTYKYDWTVDQTILASSSVARPEQAFLEAKNYWQSLGLLGQDLAEGTAKYTFYAAQPPILSPVQSLSEANFIRVDIFRAEKDKLKIVSPHNNISPVYVIFSGSSDRGKKVVEAGYTYSKTIEGDFATYPLIGVEQAWAALQQGNGYIASQGPANVTIRKVTLAYYESDAPQEFLQPVYVFEGDGGFAAYTSALDPNYLE